MGAGGIIQQRAAIKTAVTDPAIKDVLPVHCENRVIQIAAKGLADWTDEETHFMARMIAHALDC